MKPILTTAFLLCTGIAAIAAANVIKGDDPEAPLSLCEPAIAGRGKPRLSFGESGIGISTGCRSFGAHILDADKSTRFEIIQAPLIAIACSQNLEDQEIALGEVIAGATDVTVDTTGHLTLNSPTGSLVAIPWKQEHDAPKANLESELAPHRTYKEATAAARRSFSNAWRILSDPAVVEKASLYIKVKQNGDSGPILVERCSTGDAITFHCFASQASEPLAIEAGDPFSFTQDDVWDWMYEKDNKAHGSYTLRVVLRTQPEQLKGFAPLPPDPIRE